MSLEVKCSATCWPNPGPGALAYAIRLNEQVVVLHAESYGAEKAPVTNNAAELMAVGLALKELGRRGLTGAKVMTDSRLVVDQVSGSQVCDSLLLQQYRDRVRALLAETQSTLTWIPREANALADQLVSWCLPPKSYLKMKHAQKAST